VVTPNMLSINAAHCSCASMIHDSEDSYAVNNKENDLTVQRFDVAKLFIHA
jgi:hypothetical protein